MKRALILFLLISSAVPAFAIRVIGNGGGYAEMQALSALSRLRVLILPCLQRGEACALTEVEQDYLRRLDAAAAFKTGGVKLAFFTRENSGDWVRYGNGTMAVASGVLYDQAGSPLTFAEIGRAVLQAWLGRPEIPHVNGVSPAEIAGKVFSSFSASEMSWEMKALGARGHLIQASSRGTNHVFLGVEFNDMTEDLSERFLTSVPCREPAADPVVRRVHFQDSVLTGEMTWACDGEITRARFVVNFPDSREALSNGVNITWVGRHRIDPALVNCAPDLKSSP